MEIESPNEAYWIIWLDTAKAEIESKEGEKSTKGGRAVHEAPYSRLINRPPVLKNE